MKACERCKFAVQIDPALTGYFECRYGPPTVTRGISYALAIPKSVQNPTEIHWPEMHPDDYCWRFEEKADEAYVDEARFYEGVFEAVVDYIKAHPELKSSKDGPTCTMLELVYQTSAWQQREDETDADSTTTCNHPIDCDCGCRRSG